MTAPKWDLNRTMNDDDGSPPARGAPAVSMVRSGEWRREQIEELLGVAEPQELYRPADSTWARSHRLANVILALILLILASVPMLLIALAVKVTSRGPVIYKQTRVGQNRRWSQGDRRSETSGEPRGRKTSDETDRRGVGDRRAGDHWLCFTMYKFRTMCVDAECRTGAVWAQKNDPRVTSIGTFLRATRLDELPQLFNVLKGDMNIVGPRPERPQLVAVLESQIEEYRLRQLAKPGITGLAQISHNYDTCLDDVRTKVHYDLTYLRRRSLKEDLRIMARTVPVILKRMGW